MDIKSARAQIPSQNIPARARFLAISHWLDPRPAFDSARPFKGVTLALRVSLVLVRDTYLF